VFSAEPTGRVQKRAIRLLANHVLSQNRRGSAKRSLFCFALIDSVTYFFLLVFLAAFFVAFFAAFLVAI
jgi:hypothetical protein